MCRYTQFLSRYQKFQHFRFPLKFLIQFLFFNSNLWQAGVFTKLALFILFLLLARSHFHSCLLCLWLFRWQACICKRRNSFRFSSSFQQLKQVALQNFFVFNFLRVKTNLNFSLNFSKIDSRYQIRSVEINFAPLIFDRWQKICRHTHDLNHLASIKV